MMLWVFENNRKAREWYEHLGGRGMSIQSDVILCGIKYNKIAYCWPNLRNFYKLLVY